jgi:cellulose synthase/poly-beta-1,6-N-acetylglucosamine synthase-like glycosyltransferase
MKDDIVQDFFVILYFALLAYIALYGLHLYWLILLYHKHRTVRPDKTPLGDDLPIVTVQLPVYNERLVVARLIRAVAAFDWPSDRLQIQILDDSTQLVYRAAESGSNISGGPTAPGSRLVRWPTGWRLPEGNSLRYSMPTIFHAPIF